MKKLVLSLVAVSTMLAAGAANAAAPTPFNGHLDFSGIITSTVPVWKWEIPTASQALAKGWTMKKDSGTITGTNTTYTIDKANIAFLQGYTTQPIANGGTGMAPTISVAGITLSDNDHQAISVKANGGKAGQEGTLSMVVNSGAGAAFKVGSVPHNVHTNSALGNAAWGLISSHEIKGTPVMSGGFSVGEIGYNLHNPNLHNMSAAVTTDLGKFSLTFPTASVPNTWTATVPAEVTYS